MREHITMFDKPYPEEKQAEGIAISEAVAYGKCNDCNYLSQCESNIQFQFPPSAWCMRRKAEIMKRWEH